ncbi:MAG: hypothetical protein KBD16_04500 [Candidatus Pacebacteria bacterium]|nr:hypothetical protein [Candidatus Paceibacterota bacterium]
MARSTPAAQEFVPLKEIRDDIAILKDGSMRAILMVSSINFALKSQDEQHAILAQFQSFLNTLDFSLQIYVQSRRLNIQPYLALLREREPAQDNDLMRVQLREYIGFVENLTNEVEIMTKSFFVVISYTPTTLNLSGGISGLGNVFRTKSSSEADTESLARFDEDRTQIEQRVAVVTQGLSRIGVRTVTLGTNEIIELFYHLFNPSESNKALPV